MNYREAMNALKVCGTAQNRKVYARHGVSDPMFGVSYKNLSELKKQIRTDADLSEKLWQSGNHDARVLATMIADPDTLSSSRIDGWARDLSNYPLTDAFAKLVSATPHARRRMAKWTKARHEWTARAGWLVLSHLTREDAAVPKKELSEFIGTIESRIHGSKNRVRDAMNGALIAIALGNPTLERKAVAAAKRIGRVEVDHGETGCKTPDAVAYIAKAKARTART